MSYVPHGKFGGFCDPRELREVGEWDDLSLSSSHTIIEQYAQGRKAVIWGRFELTTILL